ncbi:MAG: UDP-N-acetylmuramoyl-L-alanyl-D-glutamate--2,6-diaminopimelate ligase [Deltaproteobacteria bacterium]|nr:UDP-N-acetylmuramoyl-L-alanyl-D-glutamate--2,6-diaminopimelate ligase [Deltaproteobacteria bacterium]MBW2445700.1 UDP-N-acetylmuramoyl-L-alanyl-D-glutamate--2,6-diaminopimelate ligase [Deltaproteobacteria bacterium]
MRLLHLLESLSDADGFAIQGDVGTAGETIVRGLGYDSRAVAPGDLFVALPGRDHDGHDYLADAARLGAAALLVEHPPAKPPGSLPIVRVADTRRALAPLARRFFGDPASELELIGVTGTNGKTSTSYVVESILRRTGRRVGLVGTVEIRHPGERLRAVNTTPESLDLQRTLRAMRTNQVDAVVMEVSSHGLELGRVAGCQFRVAAITNLSPEHLDFHGNMDAYAEAKLRLFRDHLHDDATAVVNLDDPRSPAFCDAARAAGARLVTTATSGEADVTLEAADVTLEGTRARLRIGGEPCELSVPLLGDFNLENLRVAVAIAYALGVGVEAIAAGVADCPQVPGRIERIAAEPGEPTVLVDYAHTPDAVEKLLRTVRSLAPQRLITVFGCGGDRDRSKRPLMAQAVARFSDRAVATSDNPRNEDPLAILDEVETGLSDLSRVAAGALDGSEASYCIEPDRRAAIELAVGIASAGDTIVIAGKGHEDYQIVGHDRLPFDDRREARRALDRAAEASAEPGRGA